jgi:hypothetical protein
MMRCSMQFMEENEYQKFPDGVHTAIPMHPDDFEAHLAWVTAKRFQERVMKETFAEKPVYYRFIGQCRHTS